MTTTPLTFTHQDEPITLLVEHAGGAWRVRLPDGRERDIAIRRLPGDVLEITEGTRTFRVSTARTERGVEIAWTGETYIFAPETGRRKRPRQPGASGGLTAPMSGIVVEVMVTLGQTVAAYQPLAAVEAMKVYATVDAPTAGTITAIHVQKGEQVTQGSPIVDVTPLAADADERPNDTVFADKLAKARAGRRGRPA